MKILVILFIIIVSFIVGYQTKNDVLKDETLNTIIDHEKSVRIKLNDISDMLDYLYDNTEISENSDKTINESQNNNKPVNTLTVKIQIPKEQYSRELNQEYYNKVQTMLHNKINDEIKVDCYFDPQWGLYNYYAYINLNKFTSQ